MATATAAIGVAGGITQTIIGASQARKARKAINNYQRQELVNVYENDRVSTRGAELQRAMTNQATATSVGALRAGGARALVGGIGRVQAQNIQQSRAIGADLDQRQVALDRRQAADQVRIQRMQERREEQDLAGLGQQLQAGNQTMLSGLSNVAGAVGAAGRMAGMAGSMAGMAESGAALNYTMPNPNKYTDLDY